MSRCLLLLAVLLACAGQASAQVTDEQLAERLDSLRPVVQAAARAAEAEAATLEEARRAAAQREVENTGVSLDTLRIGPFRVLAFLDQTALAREIFEEAWRETYPNVTTSRSLASTYFAFQWRTPQRTIVPEVPSGMAVQYVDLNRVWNPTRPRVERRVRDAAAVILSQDLPPGSPLRVWLTGWLDYRTAPGYADPEAAYRQLVMTPNGASRACLSGDVDACAVALGLRPGAPDNSAWLSLQERQDMVEGGVGLDGMPLYPHSEQARTCVEESDAAACDRALDGLVAWSVASPLTGPASLDLFWYAVRIGGTGAWVRALETDAATPAEALADVAGIDAEDLIRGWRATVLESRPDVHEGLGTRTLAASFWLLALVGLSMRSTRWRSA